MLESVADAAGKDLTGLLTALGIGLLIGAVRERRKQDGLLVVAGLRTHAVAALLGALTAWFGPSLLLAVVLLVGLFVLLSYRYTAKQDPGLTSEVALVLTVVLGALAMREAALAAAIGVVTAILLEARTALHRLTRELLTERELHDALILLASALVILPLLPDGSIDPWNAIHPQALWRVVVLVLAVGMIGHMAQRWAGIRLGLAVAGFLSGFISSTAAVAHFGDHARRNPSQIRFAIAAALFANLASLILLAGIVASLSPELIRAAAVPLLSVAVILLAGGLVGFGGALDKDESFEAEDGRSFRTGHALVLAAAIGGVMLLSAIAQHYFGDRGALAIAALAALAEWHAAAASVAQMQASAALSTEMARWGLVLLLASGGLAKSVLAWISGPRVYALAITAALLLSAAAAAATALW